MDDFELLQAYGKRQAEDSFAALVQRYINVVFSAALRQTGKHELAEEVTQAVFMVLARRAASFRPGTILTGWLLRTTYYTAINACRREQRRQHFEREAMNNVLLSQGESNWERIAPLLDQALVHLGEKDRNAIALRFFEQKSFKEIGQTVGLSENSARMRVTRALERLRRFFGRRGVTLSAVSLGTALTAHAVQPAPPGLADSISMSATSAGFGWTASTGVLATAVLKTLAWVKIKLALSLAVPTALLLVSGVYLVLPARGPNVLRNGTFDDKMSHWYGYVDPKSRADASFSVEKTPGAHGYAAKIAVTRPGYYDCVEFHQTGIAVEAGHKYIISFRARSTIAQPLRVKLISTPPPWTFYGFRVITEVTPNWQKHRLVGRAMVTAKDGKLMFQCGGIVGDLWIDDVSFQDCGEGS